MAGESVPGQRTPQVPRDASWTRGQAALRGILPDLSGYETPSTGYS